MGTVWGDPVFHEQDLFTGLSWTEMFEEGAVTLQCFCEDPQACSPYAAEFLTNSVPPWDAPGAGGACPFAKLHLTLCILLLEAWMVTNLTLPLMLHSSVCTA